MTVFWWVLVIVVVCLLFVVHYRTGMRITDRMNIALELLRTARFQRAEALEDAQREDPELVGWIKSGGECVMLFRRRSGGDTIEIVDFASPSFHPGLVIHYRNGVATRGDGQEISDPYIRKLANELLQETRRHVLAVCQSEVEIWDGCRY
ncbi:MAG: hypothetical protein KatS3mg111_4113 [Pirellulaceae bacterium]|nr:MAG: hypothetical protein KatS3mg111_4113 [Pirellulaceae bacterium]